VLYVSAKSHLKDSDESDRRERSQLAGGPSLDTGRTAVVLQCAVDNASSGDHTGTLLCGASSTELEQSNKNSKSNSNSYVGDSSPPPVSLKSATFVEDVSAEEKQEFVDMYVFVCSVFQTIATDDHSGH